MTPEQQTALDQLRSTLDSEVQLLRREPQPTDRLERQMRAADIKRYRAWGRALDALRTERGAMEAAMTEEDSICERCCRVLPADEIAPACDCGVDGLCEDCMLDHQLRSHPERELP